MARATFPQEFQQYHLSCPCGTLCTVWQQCWLLPIYDDSAVKTLDLGGVDRDLRACLCCGLLPVPGNGLAASVRKSLN